MYNLRDTETEKIIGTVDTIDDYLEFLNNMYNFEDKIYTITSATKTDIYVKDVRDLDIYELQ